MAFEPNLFPIFFLLGLVIALLTTCLYIIISYISSRITRVIIPIFYCIFIFPLIIILNPQVDNGLYPFAIIGGFIATCMLILISFPLFEKNLPGNLRKYVIFIGAMITTVFSYYLTYNQTSNPWFLVFSSLITIILAALVFAGITLVVRAFFKTSADQLISQTPEPMQPSHKLTKWKLLKIVFLLLIICMIPLIINQMMTHEGKLFENSNTYSDTQTTTLILVNENRTQSGIITHLTENDFKEFPQLTSIIQDNWQNYSYTSPDGTKVYTISLTEQEAKKFETLYWYNSSDQFVSRFFEYNGNYYSYTPLIVMPHPTP